MKEGTVINHQLHSGLCRISQIIVQKGKSCSTPEPLIHCREVLEVYHIHGRFHHPASPDTFPSSTHTFFVYDPTQYPINPLKKKINRNRRKISKDMVWILKKQTYQPFPHFNSTSHSLHPHPFPHFTSLTSDPPFTVAMPRHLRLVFLFFSGSIKFMAPPLVLIPLSLRFRVAGHSIIIPSVRSGHSTIYSGLNTILE